MRTLGGFQRSRRFVRNLAEVTNDPKHDGVRGFVYPSGDVVEMRSDRYAPEDLERMEDILFTLAVGAETLRSDRRYLLAAAAGAFVAGLAAGALAVVLLVA